MKTTKATIQLDIQGFNEMPGRAKVEEALAGIEGVSIVNSDREYWQNDNATLVFQIEASEVWRFGENNVGNAMDAMLKLGQLGADELHPFKLGNKTVYRMWWD